MCGPSILWIGNHVSHSCRVSVCSFCILMISLSRELLESVSAILMKRSGGSRAISQSLLGMSAPLGLERASAGVLTFPAMCVILKL